jgi:hypothetical protein
MKQRLNPKIFAMMAACALVTSAASIGAAHAQGMPSDARQLVQTMRPMYLAQSTSDQDQTAATSNTSDTSDTSATPSTSAMQGDDAGYGGMPAGMSASASGRSPGCSDKPRCDVFFGQ